MGSTHLSSAGSGDCAVRIFDVASAVSRTTGHSQQLKPASGPRFTTDQICVPLQVLSNGVHRALVFALTAGATPNELFSVRFPVLRLLHCFFGAFWMSLAEMQTGNSPSTNESSALSDNCACAYVQYFVCFTGVR